MPISPELRVLAEGYTEAWGSRDPRKVASFYTADGSLTVNEGAPAVGHAAIAAVARAFMTAIPDMKLFMDDLTQDGDRIIFRWTFTGSNTGPGGTGHRLRISGFEEWVLGSDGLIAQSQGHFNHSEYQRQLEHGFEAQR